ncbi:hypothetical protein A2223_00285 [Candidatus Falkowbacteria bacterium RIFOXYA2_FULL_35_8]|uniref:Uncharacterized protein n=1 Tax=Candidatus Falkowbacteria bacterium RIFOXYC2_FULL_36_12 TaxID=1798002 RepID=A0A1F5SYL2_9BACT|nr:MAG: hypothetical protein A2300_01645 [Candidatus Falkowbacteria bacterium RIFOXYB2_FULL_35_7]OGF31794.1 MAG: hypothetical protein A2478_04905 [Candidatus Falkowbacteria bacterium RIFOXYC2_FULL_36_12]OGF33796.1 MAG: hypothetical protein A2223_00285 [Candidatus Falkowbacteria bacterium RIFOXYA2_FULL_35_8]
MKKQIWLILILVMIIGFVLPIIIGVISGNVVNYNPLAIVHSSNENLSDCMIYATFQDSFSGRKFAGVDVLLVRRYSIIDENTIKPYSWFNIPLPIIKVMLGGETMRSLCE